MACWCSRSSASSFTSIRYREPLKHAWCLCLPGIAHRFMNTPPKTRASEKFYRHCKVFQSGQGLRLHHAGQRRSGRLRSHLCRSGRIDPRRPGCQLRARPGSQDREVQSRERPASLIAANKKGRGEIAPTFHSSTYPCQYIRGQSKSTRHRERHYFQRSSAMPMYGM